MINITYFIRSQEAKGGWHPHPVPPPHPPNPSLHRIVSLMHEVHVLGGVAILFCGNPGNYIIAPIAKGHDVVGEVTNIATLKTESMIQIKWSPPPTVSCGSVYKYLVAYKHDSSMHYEEVAECEYTLTNLNSDTLVKFIVRPVCPCPSNIYGKSSILIRHTSKIHIHHCAYIRPH